MPRIKLHYTSRALHLDGEAFEPLVINYYKNVMFHNFEIYKFDFIWIST